MAEPLNDNPIVTEPQVQPKPQQPAQPQFKPDEPVSIEQFEEAARQKYGIPKNLLKAMVTQESEGDHNAVSPTGVRGKYQVTQATAQEWGAANGVSNADRNNPYHQAAAAMWYLKKNYDESKDVPDSNARWLTSVGKYYGGPGAMKGSTATVASPDGVSNPSEHISRVGNYWKQLGLDGDAPIQTPNPPSEFQNIVAPPDPNAGLMPESGLDKTQIPAETQEELRKVVEGVAPGVPGELIPSTEDAATAAQRGYDKFIGEKQSGFDRDVSNASILYSKPGAKAATGFDPDTKVVSQLDASRFPVEIVANAKDRAKEFTYQYFNQLGLNPKQADDFIAATGWHLFDVNSLNQNLDNYVAGKQAALPLDVSAGTAAMVDAYKTGGAEAAKQTSARLKTMKTRFDESKHEITDDERKQFVPYAAELGAKLSNILGYTPAGWMAGLGNTNSIDVARGMMAMKLGAYQTSKENIQFWHNLTGGAAFPELAPKMAMGFHKNYDLLNQIQKSMTTGQSFAQQGVATSGMLLRNVAAGTVMAAALPVAGAGAVAATSAYNLADTFISNLHEDPTTMKNAMVTQAFLLGIPWMTKLGAGMMPKLLGKSGLTAANVAQASSVLKPAPLFSAQELGISTIASAAYMGGKAKDAGGSNQEAYAAALLGMALPATMHIGAEAVNRVKQIGMEANVKPSEAQVDFNSLRPETQKQIIDMTAQGLRHPLVSTLIETATAERAAQLGIDAKSVKQAFEAQEALSSKRTAMGGLPVQLDPAMREQYRQVLTINAGLWAEYSINGLGSIGIASMAGTDPVSIRKVSLRAPIASTTDHINTIIRDEVGDAFYNPDEPGVSVHIDNAQQLATKLMTNADPSAQSFANSLQDQVTRARNEGYDRIGIVNIERPGDLAGESAVHENLHGQTSKIIEQGVRAKAQEDATRVVSDLDLNERLAKDHGDQRASVLQTKLANQVGNVIPTATGRADRVAISGETVEKNRAVKSLDVRKQTLAGLMRNSVEASALSERFDNAMKSEGYFADSHTEGIEQIYEPVAKLTERSFLKRHGISPQEAEALVIAELQSFNTNSDAAKQLAEHLPLHERQAFLDFLGNPLSSKYETNTTAKAQASPPSPPSENPPPAGTPSSQESVQVTPPQPVEQQGRPASTEARTEPPVASETREATTQLETKPASTAEPRQERELAESRESQYPKVNELAAKLIERNNIARSEPKGVIDRLNKLVEVVNDPNMPQHVKDSHARGLFRYGVTTPELEALFREPVAPKSAPEPVKTPATDKYLETAPQYKSSTTKVTGQPNLIGEKEKVNTSTKYSGVESALKNVEEHYATRGIEPRMREYLKGQGVDVERFERMLKGEPEPEKVVTPAPEKKTQPEAPVAQETASQGGPQPKIPKEYTKELNDLREQFRAGQIAPGSTVTLSNGVKVKVPSSENQFSDIIGRKLDEGEAYGRTAQVIRRYWSGKGEGGDTAVQAVLDRFNLPGESHTREAQDLAHRAIVKSFNNPKMSLERVGALVQSEQRAGESVPEVGLNQIPSSDLFRWAKTRQLESAFPKELMTMGEDVAKGRRGNTVSLYSRKGVGIPDEGETHNVSRTSVKQVPELMRSAPIPEGSRNIDIGGGKYDLGTEVLKERGIYSKVIDPYSRDAAHNKAVEKEFSENPADTATVANVLNVIKEPAIRKSVIQNAGKYVKPGGKIFFDVYEGNAKGQGVATKVGTWQENRKIAEYLPEVRAVYPDAKLEKSAKGRYIVATNDQKTSLYNRTPKSIKDKSIEHPSDDLNGQKLIGRTSDGRAIIPNENNKSGVSIVKDRSFRETPSWDTTIPLYSRYGNGVNPKEEFQRRIGALYSEKHFDAIPVAEKNQVRQAFSAAQQAWNRNDPKAFAEATIKATYLENAIIGKTKSNAEKLAEVGVTAVRLNPLLSVSARAADVTGTNINVQTQLAANPLKRFIGYMADVYLAPKAAAAKNKAENTNTTLKETKAISKTIPKLHAEDWLKGTGVGTVEGAKDAVQILKKGYSDFQMQTGMSYQFDRSQTGWTGTDKVMNRVAGAVGNAPDAFARGISFDVIVRQFAREHSLQFPEAQRSAQFEKFYKNVPEEVVGLATALTEKYTYNNPNAAAEMIHSYIDKFAPEGTKAAYHAAANLTYRYVRVPTNVAMQTTRLSGITGPGMMAWDAYHLYNNLFKSYDTKTGKFGMTLGERRVAVEKLTESTMGAMLMAGVAAGILAFGKNNSYVQGVKKNVAGSYDENDQKASKREEIRQLEPGAVNIPGINKTVKTQVLGPYQRVLQGQKDIFKGIGYQGLKDDKLREGTAGDLASSYGEAALNQLEDYPLVGNTKRAFDNAYGRRKTDFAKSAADALTIDATRNISDYVDPVKRVPRKGSFTDNLKANYGLGKDLPAKVDSAGEPVYKRNVGSLYTKNYPTSDGLDEIERLGLSLPRHTVGDEKSKLSHEEQGDRASYLGKRLKEAADKIVTSKEYQSAPDDQTKALLLDNSIEQINTNVDLTVLEAYHNSRINAEFFKRKQRLEESQAFKRLTPSQQQNASTYLKSQFHKFMVDSAKKEKGDVSTIELYADFRDFLATEMSDALINSIEKGNEKKQLPYERSRK